MALATRLSTSGLEGIARWPIFLELNQGGFLEAVVFLESRRKQQYPPQTPPLSSISFPSPEPGLAIRIVSPFLVDGASIVVVDVLLSLSPSNSSSHYKLCRSLLLLELAGRLSPFSLPTSYLENRSTTSIDSFLTLFTSSPGNRKFSFKPWLPTRPSSPLALTRAKA